MQRWWPGLAAGVTGSRVSTPVRGAGPCIDRWWRPESWARPSLSGPQPHACELRPGEPVVAAANPVAERIRRVLEQGRVVEPGEGPHGQGTLDRVVADVGCRSDGTVGGPDALQPRPAPREIAVQPRPQRHEGEQEGEHHCDDEDELLQLRAEVGQRPAGAGGPLSDFGTQLEQFIFIVAVVLALLLALVTLGPWLNRYLPWRWARLQRVRAAHRAIRTAPDVGDDSIERALAMRAFTRLDYSTLLEYTPDPFGDWVSGRHDRLARAELASVGLRP